jgi:phosphatidylserine/phosphatidylglycerophosphate/cardiolipin synthase-like enzyme
VRAIARGIAEHPSGLGRVFLWRNGDDPRVLGGDADIPDRYNHCHQKFIIADRERALIGSDNLTQSSLPADPRENGTAGSRGAFLVTDASCVVDRLVDIFEADCDPARHRDIRRFVSRAELDERTPRLGSDRSGYDPVAPAPFVSRVKASFELSHSPENSLRPDQAYLGLVNGCGAGDWILVQQQYERPHWGYGAAQTPNPRLEAYLAAARRGARVRLLLNGAGGPERNAKNRAACRMLNETAAREGLDCIARLAFLPDARKNREGAIHNKMLLLRQGRRFWSHVGSANGSETAHRYNREVGLSVESVELFEYLAAVFRADWQAAAERDETPRPGDGVLEELPPAWRDVPRRP